MTSQEQELLTRVARAMQASKAWPAVFDAGSAEVLARAAIEAMMVPTLAMKNAGWREATAQGHDATEIEVEPIYAAMIRASLSKGEK